MSVPVMRASLAGALREHNAARRSCPPQRSETAVRRLNRRLLKRLYNYFVVGNPIAFQALKPPAME
jgi:hypothetical protein